VAVRWVVVMVMAVCVFVGMAANGDLPAEAASAFFAHIKRSPPS